MATSPAKKDSYFPTQVSVADVSGACEGYDAIDEALDNAFNLMLTEGGYTIEEIRQMIAEGMASLERGEMTSADEVFQMLRARRNALRAKSQA